MTAWIGKFLVVSGKFLAAFAITLLAALGAMMVYFGLWGSHGGGEGDAFTLESEYLGLLVRSCCTGSFFGGPSNIDTQA
jgi:hypothetical protein